MKHRHDDTTRDLARAWEEGYKAAWKDHECDLPEHNSDNPYKTKDNNQ